MRALIRQSSGCVTLSYDNDLGDRIERRFVAPRTFGYVRELTHGGTTQPCDGLAKYGETLMCTEATLLATIRREYQRMRQIERRNNRRNWGS